MKYKIPDYLIFSHKIYSLNFFLPSCTVTDSGNDDYVAVHVTIAAFG